MKRLSLSTAFAAIALFVTAQTVSPDTTQFDPQLPPPPPEAFQGDSLAPPPPPQGNRQRRGPRRPRFTAEQMTTTMTEVLGLDEKQAKEVEKLNKKNSTLIEGFRRQRPDSINGEARGPRGGGHRGMRGMGGPGGGMPPGGMGGGMPGGGMPPEGMGGGMGFRGNRPSREDFEARLIQMGEDQEKYDKKLAKILNDEQMETYTESIKQHFASQWMMKEFLYGPQQAAPNEK